MAGLNDGGALPEGVNSLLDTDLYKLTMQCCVLKYFPNVNVTYSFTNRTPHMRFTRAAYRWLQSQINKLGNITFSQEELDFLKKNWDEPFMILEKSYTGRDVGLESLIPSRSSNTVDSLLAQSYQPELATTCVGTKRRRGPFCMVSVSAVLKSHSYTQYTVGRRTECAHGCHTMTCALNIVRT